ncbi:MAG TPA: hypothetical protein VK923_07135 [Euzebyales bacterium]|nr:hypothetical protein [Euzebyales bacterium]
MQKLRALFQQRVAGDDALLRLARLRFEQAGLGAELHADDIDSLEHALRYAPDWIAPPTVHLDRGLDLLSREDRAKVAAFVQNFDGRVAGFVVHDTKHMAERTDELVAVLRRFDAEVAGCRPMLFLEYAAGHDPAWFGDLGARLADITSVSLCVDVGHVGIYQAHRAFAASCPGVQIARLQTDDELLVRHVDDLQRAVATALPTVLTMTRTLSRAGKPLHFHVHDGHPLVAGVSDHISFLTRVPLTFAYQGRRALDTMYGPDGLRAIVDTAVAAAAPSGRPSFMLEIHQAEGRRPLGDAVDLFAHWSDLTNAERTNHWLAVLAENARLF